jgi:LPS sulfotransferase NodH
LAVKHYAICFTPLAGHQWLKQLLGATGKLGMPAEHFSPQALPQLLKKIPCRTINEYVDFIRREHRSENGIFGVQISWPQLQLLDQIASLEDLFGRDLVYFYLTRKDFLLQAVLLYRATARVRSSDYDADGIAQRAVQVLQQEYQFERYFRNRGVTPIRLAYEELIRDSHAMVSLIARRLGILSSELPPPAAAAEGAPKSSDVEWAQRFRAERPSLVQRWSALRGTKPPEAPAAPGKQHVPPAVRNG